MAEHKTQIDFVEVKSQDIMAERQRMWDAFGSFTKMSIIATIVLLLGIYLIWG